MKSLVLFLLIASASFAQVIHWTQSSGGVSIAVDNSDNAFTVAYDYNPAGDIYLTKRDLNGNLLWVAKYDQTDNSKWEKATWVETDNNGNAIVTGTLMSGYSNPVNAASIVMKFSPQGTLLWRNVYENSFDGSYTKQCLVDASNNVYVLGIGFNGTGQSTKVKKFAPDGSAIWIYYDFDGIGAPLYFKFTRDNAIVISGRGITGSINGFARIDLAGNKQWSIAGVNSITTGDAAGDSDGNTYIISGLYGSSTLSTLKKVTSTGNTIWENNFLIAGLRIEIGNDNLPVISGYPNTGSFGSSFIKVDQNGSVLWANPNADSTLNLLAHAQMKIDQFNNIYIAASIMTHMAVCKVNSNGSSGWTITIPTGYAKALDFGSDNSVYVVGGSTSGAGDGGTGRILQPLTSISGNSNFIPTESWLGNNYPNPFNPETIIKFGIAAEGMYSVIVYNLTGQVISVLAEGYKKPGEYSVRFKSSGLPSGIYFYKLESYHFSETKRMILLK
jgi:hypothetical protein